MIDERSPWFPFRHAPTWSGIRLICLPPAGAGAAGYRAWKTSVGGDIEAIPVQLPGRESRRSERLIESAQELVEQLVEPVAQACAGGRFALFGHSMGALLAHDLAHALAERGQPPMHLIVSAHHPPHVSVPPTPPVEGMTDPDLIEYLSARGGTSDEVLQTPELMEIYLPVLRADLLVCESYRHLPRPPLSMPITALGGDSDPMVAPELLARWSELTVAGFRTKVLAGGHNYLHEDVAAVTREVSATLLNPPAPLAS